MLAYLLGKTLEHYIEGKPEDIETKKLQLLTFISKRKQWLFVPWITCPCN